MATRSMIWQKTEQGYRGVYCHWDGYPEGVGRTLQEHYSDPSKVDALLEYAHTRKMTLHTLRENPDNSVWEVFTPSEKPDREGGHPLPSSRSFMDTRRDFLAINWSYIFDGKSWETHRVDWDDQPERQ